MESLQPSPSLRSTYIADYGIPHSTVLFEEPLELPSSIQYDIADLGREYSPISPLRDSVWLPERFIPAYSVARLVTTSDHSTPAPETSQLGALSRLICLSTSHINIIALTESFLDRSLRLLLLYEDTDSASLRLLPTLSLLIHALKLCPEPSLRALALDEGTNLTARTLLRLSSARLRSSSIQQALPCILQQVYHRCLIHEPNVAGSTPNHLVATRNLLTLAQVGYCPMAFHIFREQFSYVLSQITSVYLTLPSDDMRVLDKIDRLDDLAFSFQKSTGPERDGIRILMDAEVDDINAEPVIVQNYDVCNFCGCPSDLYDGVVEGAHCNCDLEC